MTLKLVLYLNMTCSGLASLETVSLSYTGLQGFQSQALLEQLAKEESKVASILASSCSTPPPRSPPSACAATTCQESPLRPWPRLWRDYRLSTSGTVGSLRNRYRRKYK